MFFANQAILSIERVPNKQGNRPLPVLAKKDKRILRRFAVVSGFVEEGQKPGIPLDFGKEFLYHGVINSDQCTRE